jgi:hypothetical protein
MRLTRPTPILLAGFALALALRLATLDRREVWIDEALTQFALSLDWSALIADRLAAGHSPFYFLLLKALGLDPGHVLPLRALAALLDATACTLLGATVLRIAGTRAALFGMLLYAASPVLIAWGQNARPYALMMAFLALGLFGAAGLLGTANRNRADAMCFAIGLTGAALTLTAGAIAALIVAVTTFSATPKHQQRTLLPALTPPLAALAVMAVMVTTPAVRSQSQTYWTERVAPFGAEALVSLLRGLTLGDRLSQGEVQHVLGIIPWQAATVFALAALGVAIAAAVPVLRRAPALLPFAALSLVYPVLLLALSLSTSLLIPRYFLPALGPTLMIAGIGLAVLSRRRWGRAPVAAALTVCTILAVHHALSLGPRRSDAPRKLAAIVLSDPAPGTTLLRAPGDWVGFDTMAEILPRALGPAPNPRVIEAAPDAIPDVLAGPAFLVLHEALWRDVYRAALPRPDCLWPSGPAILAYWGSPRDDCLSE